MGTPALRGVLRVFAWPVWASGFALTIFTVSGSVSGMVISTAALITLLCHGLQRLDGSSSGKIELTKICENRSERFEIVDLRCDFPQRLHSFRNVLQKFFVPSDQAQKAISPQRLHQALHRA
jgi:hypothetical protein